MRSRYTVTVLGTGICLILACLVLTGCGRPPQPPVPEYVIRAGAVSVTLDDFLAELDLKLSAYPYDIRKSPDRYNEVVVDLVATLSEESLLLAAAAEKGISVSEEELATARQEFLTDYPGDSFEQMLLENAVSLSLWQSKLARSLVIQKFVQAELIDPLEITPGDVKQFFDRQVAGGKPTGQVKGDVDETRLLKRLRLEKGQDNYQEWVLSLKQAIPVHINKQAVTNILIDWQSKGTSNG